VGFLETTLMEHLISKVKSLFKPKEKPILDKDFFKNCHIQMKELDCSHIQAKELKPPKQ